MTSMSLDDYRRQGGRMAYQTRFQLLWTISGDLTSAEDSLYLYDRILDWLGSHGMRGTAITYEQRREYYKEIIEGRTTDSWYDHEFDLKNLASHFFSVKFELWGIGESFSDMWHKAVMDGHIITHTAKLVPVKLMHARQAEST